jgi:hypothetical protein
MPYVPFLHRQPHYHCTHSIMDSGRKKVYGTNTYASRFSFSAVFRRPCRTSQTFRFSLPCPSLSACVDKPTKPPLSGSHAYTPRTNSVDPQWKTLSIRCNYRASWHSSIYCFPFREHMCMWDVCDFLFGCFPSPTWEFIHTYGKYLLGVCTQQTAVLSPAPAVIMHRHRTLLTSPTCETPLYRHPPVKIINNSKG